MSMDGEYILWYSVPCNSEIKHDSELLKNEHGGELTELGDSSYFYQKPKGILFPSVFNALCANQILEKQDGSFWRVVKGNKVIRNGVKCRLDWIDKCGAPEDE